MALSAAERLAGADGATQVNGYMAMKSLMETELMSRLAGRIEALLPDGEQRPLVVFGRPSFPHEGLIGVRRRPLQAQVTSTSFASYRQVTILHYFMGNRVLRGPEPEEVERARAASAGHAAWPAADSVFLADGAMIVLLELPTERSPVTWR